MRRRVLILVLVVLVTCTGMYFYPAKQIPLGPAECQPTDQDQYVYSPERFLTLASCLRVSGIAHGILRGGEDGDAAFELDVDSPYRFTLNFMNDRNTQGYLHIEIICQVNPEYGPAAQACARDPHPYSDAFPEEEQHIWVEGRWVLDINHGGHAELHPLYRWGSLE